MKTVVNKTIEVQKQETTSIKCDFCEKEILNRTLGEEKKELHEVYGFDTWGNNYSDITVEARYSHSFGNDGGNGLTYQLDVCPTCFKTHIIDKAKKIEPKAFDF